MLADLQTMLEALIRVDEGAIDLADKKGSTLLQTTAEFGCLLPTKLLLDNGADVELADKDGLTALHWAATAEASTCRTSSR